MTLELLKIHNFRSFSQSEFQFSPNINCIVAPNGKGKTTLLEAIYLLSCGRSFKTRETTPLIQFEQTSLTVFGRLQNSESISISKSVRDVSQIKINGDSCFRTSELAYRLPCQVYYQDIFAVIDGGPSIRRTLIDWGLFHVEHTYHRLMKQYTILIKQRNALLRQKAKKSAFAPWDAQISEIGEQIDSFRRAYIDTLKIEVSSILRGLTSIELDMTYYKGWDRKSNGYSLQHQLNEYYDKDLLRGYTSVGVQQADLCLNTQDALAKKTLSRGQQKIVLIALKLAQASLLNKHCVHLCDDVFAELDGEHIERLLATIETFNSQFIITLLPEYRSKLECLKKTHWIELSNIPEIS